MRFLRLARLTALTGLLNSLPLTAHACVDRIYTDMAVIDITAEGMVLREIAEGLSIDEVVAATDVPLLIEASALTTF